MASDLLLIAVRYVAGELPDDEEAAFETRLAGDQEAREAVARAVELGAAIAHLSPVIPDRLFYRRPWQRGLLAFASAAVLVIGIGVPLWVRYAFRPAARPAPVAATTVQPENIALTWSGLRQSGEIDLVSHSELVAWLDEPAAPPAADVVSGEGDDEGLPAWLLEAASLRQPLPSQAGPREN